MSRKTEHLSDELHAYILDHGSRPDQVQEALIEETAALGRVAGMQIAPEQGAFMEMLARIVDARFAVEVGTFTGYSAMCIARGLSPGGKLLCCDISEEWTGIARRYWERAGVADRIELRIGPALETLRALPEDAEIDLAFVDADKGGYVDYWEELVPRMRLGGVLLIDNVFAGGRVVEEKPGDDTARDIKAFNAHAVEDARVDLVMLPIADGLTLARKL
ncbi:MAG: O-methyltransferase [Sporichthyaceae bacterium]|nr:O-methyltransferase [Sporichthyaceae bacterium]